MQRDDFYKLNVGQEIYYKGNKVRIEALQARLLGDGCHCSILFNESNSSETAFHYTFDKIMQDLSFELSGKKQDHIQMPEHIHMVDKTCEHFYDCSGYYICKEKRELIEKGKANCSSCEYYTKRLKPNKHCKTCKHFFFPCICLIDKADICMNDASFKYHENIPEKTTRTRYYAVTSMYTKSWFSLQFLSDDNKYLDKQLGFDSKLERLDFLKVEPETGRIYIEV